MSRFSVCTKIYTLYNGLPFPFLTLLDLTRWEYTGVQGKFQLKEIVQTLKVYKDDSFFFFPLHVNLIFWCVENDFSTLKFFYEFYFVPSIPLSLYFVGLDFLIVSLSDCESFLTSERFVGLQSAVVSFFWQTKPHCSFYYTRVSFVYRVISINSYKIIFLLKFSTLILCPFHCFLPRSTLDYPH